jgi:quercetin dioxygenase-like cupin family protein
MMKPYVLLAVCSLFVAQRDLLGADEASAAKAVAAAANILAPSDVPWEKLDTGARRKVVFSGQLTLVILEAPGPTSAPIAMHQHVNDQITYVIDGEMRVHVGDETKQIGKGGFFRVPANVPHGIQILGPSVTLVDVFTPPREDFRRK